MILLVRLFLLGVAVLQTVAGKEKKEPETPHYKVYGTRDGYEIREYHSGTWVGAKLTGASVDDAMIAGPQILDQYFSGSNVPAVHLDKTNPFFLDFEPALDADGNVNGTTQKFITWMVLPRAVWDDPPAPGPLGPMHPEVSRVPRFWTFTKSFSGACSESDILHQVSKLNKTLADDGVVTVPQQPAESWGFSHAVYKGKVARDRHEVHWAVFTKPKKDDHAEECETEDCKKTQEGLRPLTS